MRTTTAGLALVIAMLAMAGSARADEFMTECRVTASQKMCDCISGRIAPDMRAKAVAGLRKSNASVAATGSLLDPATLSQNEMQGLNAVVAAQAYCM